MQGPAALRRKNCRHGGPSLWAKTQGRPPDLLSAADLPVLSRDEDARAAAFQRRLYS